MVPTGLINESLSFPAKYFLGKNFGNLNLYRNEDWKPLQVYGTPNALVVQNGLNETVNTVQQDNFTVGESVLLLSDQLSFQQLNGLSMDWFVLARMQMYR